MSTFRVQRAVVGGHLHSDNEGKPAPFMCGSEGRLPVSMCVCDLRKGGVCLQHPCCLDSDFLVNILLFGGGMQIFPNTSRMTACSFLCLLVGFIFQIFKHHHIL